MYMNNVCAVPTKAEEGNRCLGSGVKGVVSCHLGVGS